LTVQHLAGAARDIKSGPLTTTIEIIVAPLPKRPGRYEVRGASGILLVASSRQPWCDTAIRLLTQGYGPATILIMRRAGSDTEVRRSAIRAAADLASRLSPVAAKHSLTADDVPDGHDEAALIEFMERLRLHRVPDGVADELIATAFPDPMVPVKTVMVVPDTDMVVPDSRARIAARFAARDDDAPPDDQRMADDGRAQPEPPGTPANEPEKPAEVVAPPPADRKRRLKLLDAMALDPAVSDLEFRRTFAAWRNLRGHP
jgi:hypothetical protein